MHINGIAYLMLLIYAVHCGYAALANHSASLERKCGFAADWSAQQARSYAVRILALAVYAAWQLGWIKWA